MNKLGLRQQLMADAIASSGMSQTEVATINAHAMKTMAGWGGVPQAMRNQVQTISNVIGSDAVRARADELMGSMKELLLHNSIVAVTHSDPGGENWLSETIKQTLPSIQSRLKSEMIVPEQVEELVYNTEVENIYYNYAVEGLYSNEFTNKEDVHVEYFESYSKDPKDKIRISVRDRNAILQTYGTMTDLLIEQDIKEREEKSEFTPLIP